MRVRNVTCDRSSECGNADGRQVTYFRRFKRIFGCEVNVQEKDSPLIHGPGWTQYRRNPFVQIVSFWPSTDNDFVTISLPSDHRTHVPAVWWWVQCDLSQFLLDSESRRMRETACLTHCSDLTTNSDSHLLALVLSNLDILGLSLTSRLESPFAAAAGKWDCGEFVAAE